MVSTGIIKKASKELLDTDIVPSETELVACNLDFRVLEGKLRDLL